MRSKPSRHQIHHLIQQHADVKRDFNEIVKRNLEKCIELHDLRQWLLGVEGIGDDTVLQICWDIARWLEEMNGPAPPVTGDD